ncbi:hypothetical protein MPSEU_000713100 [Mayamaea pseudoterrestris]|nr:hypothetical protein MPSEU_000713100 [Mayamaea pseudoterrestris]
MATASASVATKTRSRRNKGVKDVVVAKEQNTNDDVKDTLADEHLPPLFLVGVVLMCSGALFVLAMRDFFSTGKVIAGAWDEAMMDFTKSRQWFEDGKGWKSTQGGFSAIKQVTTDQNNMGGFFIRKLGGVAALGVHLQKLAPLLFHFSGAQWNLGHYRPILMLGLVANIVISGFLASYMEDMAAAGATDLPMFSIGLLAIESIVFMYYLLQTRNAQRGPAIAMTEGKTPSSTSSKIVARTLMMVSGVVALVSARDFFLPGAIMDFIPRDDIYLEWTNALIHSPQDGTIESVDHGLEAAFYTGDKFSSQYTALHILLLCMFKFATAVAIKYGSDGSGLIKCKMIWAVQFLADAGILFVFRLFAGAASSASLDLRWHLMCLSYETIILGLYTYA